MRAILDPGDEVIVPEPTYVSYIPCVHLSGGVPVTVPTHMENGFRVRPEDIEARVTPRTKAILMGYPNNPTGAVMPRGDMERIADIARRHDLLVGLRRDIRAAGVWRGARLLCLTARNGRTHHTPGRLLQVLRNDGMARRIRLRRPGDHRGHNEGAPVHRDVRAHPRARWEPSRRYAPETAPWRRCGRSTTAVATSWCGA